LEEVHCRCIALASGVASYFGVDEIEKCGLHGLGSKETFRSIEVAIDGLMGLVKNLKAHCPSLLHGTDMRALTQIRTCTPS
jgi:hypothetical protein